MSIASLKSEFRKETRGRVRALSDVAREAQSRAVCERLLQSPLLSRPGVILGYLALPDELDLDPLLSTLIGLGREAAAPRVEWETRQMAPMKLADLSAVDVRHHGVREPHADAPARLNELSLVIVPGAAFDADRRRLGRGGGFYDRFLASLRSVSEAPLIGVAFDEQIVPKVPIEEHDAAVDAVVTATRWIGAHRPAAMR